jgi:hypothetical protein
MKYLITGLLCLVFMTAATRPSEPVINAKTFITSFPEAAKAANMTATEVDLVVRAWNDAGVKTDQLKGEISSSEFNARLAIFVKSARRIHAAPISPGEAYWLVFCISESLARAPTDEKSRKMLVADDKAFNEICLQKLKNQILRQVPLDKQAAVSKLIESNLQDAKLRLEAAVDDLSADVLFPGLKQKLSDQVKKRISDQFDKDFYIKYGDTGNSLMMTPDEYYAQSLNAFFRTFPANQMLDIAMSDFEWHLDNTLLWGQMRWSGRGTGDITWPVWISMEKPKRTAKEDE